MPTRAWVPAPERPRRRSEGPGWRARSSWHHDDVVGLDRDVLLRRQTAAHFVVVEVVANFDPVTGALADEVNLVAMGEVAQPARLGDGVQDGRRLRQHH